VLRANESGSKRQSGSGSDLRHDRLRYFWLCDACSQSLTIQATPAGRARIAPRRMSGGNDIVAPASGAPELTDCEVEAPMFTTEEKLAVLKRELEFLANGGYRMAIGWCPPLIFEDSPICPKAPHAACPDSRCVLIDFVPGACQQEKIPCRHIPLNEGGETLHTLYSTANAEEIENALRAWLSMEIEKLEHEASQQQQGDDA
jgi:hypothetical protein